ncbi:hypothetical protein ONZ45_g12304 [Pleurotus djamor]|nr:hypothetical protein ONZ45_g12304 [Pleurotus djamor]
MLVPVPEYTRTVVGPAYHAMMALPASEREHEMQVVFDWYEKATTNSVNDMHRTGQIGKQVEKIAFQYTQLARHDYELYDIHSFRYIFALSQTKKGVPIRQVWSGTPLLPDVLKSGWTANWQRHLHAVESLLVTQREKSLAAKQQKTCKPPPYLWLLDVDFTIHGRQNVIQRERNPVDPALVKGMPWATWDSSAYHEQMVMLNWPAGFLHPGSQDSGYNIRHIPLKYVSKVVEPWIRCKDRELYDHEYSQLFAIRPWSQRAWDLPLASQGRILLVIDTNGTVLLRVEDCKQYTKDLSKEPEGESSTAPGSILEDDEDESVFYVPLPLPPHLDPNQPEEEWDYKNLPQAGPSRLPLQSEASTSHQASSTHPQLSGPAVRPDGTLRDAGEIDFSEDVEVALPSTPPPARLVTPRSPPSVPPPKRRKRAKVLEPNPERQGGVGFERRWS